MRKSVLGVAIVLAVGLVSGAIAEDAAKCRKCHKAPEFEDKTEAELVEAIKATQSSKKHKFTQGLSDEQIQAIAEALLAQ
jgi:hypothetical protein